ncbi:uncharacterized protein GGS22DRAFT_167475 [Annulohypoxylon maeteangense]|uniref:uncharacterized protein n=1 Tax=Annulohypoxylon maeteangense TaxID=1927788 RepID=UPI0020083372|nr:uncharacterized protein GGS22DRAFT_167475 [Annulohypoxylon maeteangense]KAI0883586.1 hypothetical protein GGS22DRAFT_167475 [Annulohypoxylon maeteangense]
MVLKLRGYAFDHITTLSQAPIKELYPNGSQHFYNGRDDIFGVFGRMMDPGGFDTLKEVLLQYAQNPEKVQEKLNNHFRTHRDYLPGEAVKILKMTQGHCEKSGCYETIETLTCLDRCFFRTSNGAFVFCPWTAREGDVVTMLFEAKVPYLLRPVRGYIDQIVDDTCADAYQLVGECYLDGYMNGEILETQNALSIQVLLFDLV